MSRLDRREALAANAIRNARVRAAAGCPACGTYAWAWFTMPTKVDGGRWHHPSCPCVRGAGVEILPSYWTRGITASSDTVVAVASQFDTDFRGFSAVVDQNPVFGERVYRKMSGEQRAANEAFRDAWVGLYQEWAGTLDDDADYAETLAWRRSKKMLGGLSELSYMKPEEMGYYRTVKAKKDSSTELLGQTEIAQVADFRHRLIGLKMAYGELGYADPSRMSEEPKPAPNPLDTALTAVKWLAGATIVVGGVMLVQRVAPVVRAMQQPAAVGGV